MLAVDEVTGRPAGLVRLRARFGRHVAAIIGRHDQCDLFLDKHSSLALRHLAVVLDPVQSWRAARPRSAIACSICAPTAASSTSTAARCAASRPRARVHALRRSRAVHPAARRSEDWPENPTTRGRCCPSASTSTSCAAIRRARSTNLPIKRASASPDAHEHDLSHARPARHGRSASSTAATSRARSSIDRPEPARTLTLGDQRAPRRHSARTLRALRRRRARSTIRRCRASMSCSSTSTTRCSRSTPRAATAATCQDERNRPRDHGSMRDTDVHLGKQHAHSLALDRLTTTLRACELRCVALFVLLMSVAPARAQPRDDSARERRRASSIASPARSPRSTGNYPGRRARDDGHWRSDLGAPRSHRAVRSLRRSAPGHLLQLRHRRLPPSARDGVRGSSAARTASGSAR